ncbi:hypothetical protein GCM10007216_05040 [Thalassobacillus devorans]|uniref:Uncharacterized protein n=1 Tax=Thalassobacillus devorans TaxID=279813 RepID=A0ABQ1NI98_9BACI|nr:hypothetical protein [Thalassobacillus devorans]GGC77510.1 hypothetical protein GCM10007216_05040 [Thalassobacillus devorans]
MGLIIAILAIVSSAGFLYYWGKSGFDWGISQPNKKGEEE